MIFLLIGFLVTNSVYGTSPEGLPVAVPVDPKPIEAQNVMPVQENPEEPNNTASCKLFAWWWYVTADMFDASRKEAFLTRDARLSGCDMGEFCATCGPFTCTLSEKYYACRNLCDNRPSKPRFLSACHAVGKVPHGLWYYIQKKKGMVPVPKHILEKYKDSKIVWERPFSFPQLNKLGKNTGWKGDDDQNLPEGVPFPFDYPQVAMSGGVPQGTPSPVSIRTDGKGYTRYRTIQDGANPMTDAALEAQKKQYTDTIRSLPTSNGSTAMIIK